MSYRELDKDALIEQLQAEIRDLKSKLEKGRNKRFWCPKITSISLKENGNFSVNLLFQEGMNDSYSFSKEDLEEIGNPRVGDLVSLEIYPSRKQK